MAKNKNPVPVVNSGGGLLSKLVGWGMVIAGVTLVVKHPSEAAGWFKAALETLSSVIEGFAIFLGLILG